MRYALAFLLTLCVRLVSADDIDMTYSDCVASWGEPDYIEMNDVQNPQSPTVMFRWDALGIKKGAVVNLFSDEGKFDKTGRPGLRIQFHFQKAPEPLWRNQAPMDVEYIFVDGDDYKGHEKALEFNKGDSEWEKPERVGDVDPITGITNGKFGERKWKRSDGKASATLLDFGEFGWILRVGYNNWAERNNPNKHEEDMPTVMQEQDKKPTYVEYRTRSFESISLDDAKDLASVKTKLLKIESKSPLTAEVAKILATCQTQVLKLCIGDSISVEVAEELARFTGNKRTYNFLSFDTTTMISPEVAKRLAASEVHELGLDGLAAIPTEVADELSNFQHTLSLSGLETLTPKEARALARRPENTTLSIGLTSITPDVARELMYFRGKEIIFSNLESITPTVANFISTIPTESSLSNLRGICLAIDKQSLALEQASKKLEEQSKELDIPLSELNVQHILDQMVDGRRITSADLWGYVAGVRNLPAKDFEDLPDDLRFAFVPKDFSGDPYDAISEFRTYHSISSAKRKLAECLWNPEQRQPVLDWLEQQPALNMPEVKERIVYLPRIHSITPEVATVFSYSKNYFQLGKQCRTRLTGLKSISLEVASKLLSQNVKKIDASILKKLRNFGIRDLENFNELGEALGPKNK